MYECPNCAANLKFHIGLQRLYCESCETTLNPYAFQKDKDAEESELFEVTVFRCPQCGGELLTEDTTAATFCSYCDSSTILDSRISQEKRPSTIIPFQKTKEDCRTAYQKMVKRALFAPKELRDVNHIEKFRGIYMPYWIYSFSKHGKSTFQGEQDGEKYISHFNIDSQIDAEYSDIVYDASSTFSDNLSSAIGPYHMKGQIPFTPSFLSGFYADSGDVESSHYQKDAEELVITDMTEELKKQKFYTEYHMDRHIKEITVEKTLKPENTRVTLAMLPVWFLAYRKKDRVAYAVVNGQTGEAAADLPIDEKKFLLGSLLMTVPIFLLLNAFLTLTPSVLLGCCAVIASLFSVLVNSLTTDILLKESYMDTKLLQAQRKEATRQKDKIEIFFGAIILIAIELPFVIGGLFSIITSEYAKYLLLLADLIFVVYLCMDLSHHKKPEYSKYINTIIHKQYWKKKLHIMIKPLIAITLAMIIIVINPVSDMIYYVCALICIGILLWCVYDIIECHNLLSTRKLPQLNKRGGEHLE